MAILKNLVVNGSARIINKLYCGELAVSGASTFGAITASSLSSTGTISATGNISSSGSVTGATGLVSTNGNVTLAGKVAASVSGNYLVLASGFSSGVQLNAKNLTTTGTINTGSIITNSATISNGVVSGKFIVNGVLESNEHIANIVRNVGGDLKLGPTFEAMSSTTLSVTAVTATTVSFTLYDTNITSATYGSATWYKNSEILFSGIVTGNINTSDNPKIVFSSAPGTVTARMNTTAKTLQIIVDYSDANQYFKVGNNLTYEDVSVMMYRINKDEAGTLYPIGIYLKSYGTNKESFVDVYGGTSQTPNARLGLLNGLSNMVSGNTPSGWGVYTTNGFFEGVLVSTSGIIGGWEISNTRLKKGTLGSDDSIYVLTQDISSAESVAIGGSGALTSWRVAVGSKFGIDKNGVVYASDGHFSGTVNANNGIIGGWNMAQNKIYNSSDTTLFYLQNPNIKYISKSAFSGSNGSPSFNDSNSSVDFDVNVTSSSNYTYMQINWDNNLFQENGKYKLVFELLEFNADKNIGDSSTKRLHVYTTNTSSGYSPYATPFPISLDNLQHDSVYNSDKGYNVYRNTITKTYDLINQTGSQSITKTFIAIWRASTGNVNSQYGDVDFVCRISVLKDDVLYAVIEKDTAEAQVIIGCDVTNDNVTTKPFYVQSDGLLHTENLDAVGGTIGGWTINSNSLVGVRNKKDADGTDVPIGYTTLKLPANIQGKTSEPYDLSVLTGIQGRIELWWAWEGGGTREITIEALNTADTFTFGVQATWHNDDHEYDEGYISGDNTETSLEFDMGWSAASDKMTYVYVRLLIPANTSTTGFNHYDLLARVSDGEGGYVAPYNVVVGAGTYATDITGVPTDVVPDDAFLSITNALMQPYWYVRSNGNMLANAILALGGIATNTSDGIIQDLYNGIPGELGGFKQYPYAASSSHAPSSYGGQLLVYGDRKEGSIFAQIAIDESGLWFRNCYNVSGQVFGDDWTSLSKPNRLHNFFSSRPTSANILSDTRDNTVKYFLATSAMTTGKPPIGDAHVLHFGWDAANMWDAQVAFKNTYQHITAANAMAIRAGDGNNSVWGDWKTLMDLLYPVGSEFITSTNTNPSNSALLGGGTWTLVKRVMENKSVSDAITWNTTNTVSNSTSAVFWVRDTRITYRIRFTNKVALTDTAVVIGNLNLDKLGLSSCYYCTAIGGDDTANAIIMFDILNTSPFSLRSIDIVGGSVAASTSTSPTVTLMGEIGFDTASIKDSACNQFVWKRTA